MARASITRASKQEYISTSQLTFEGFETPFAKKLDPNNRWVVLAHRIPWDRLVTLYQKQLNHHTNGASLINPRVAIGAVIIKQLCELTDREAVLQIQENMYMQYFIGYSSFSNEAPFDASLFVSIRFRLNFDLVGKMNEMMLDLEHSRTQAPDSSINADVTQTNIEDTPTVANEVAPTHNGTMITDATAAPQDISYPTDLNLLNDAREKAEAKIDILHSHIMAEEKPRTYRESARKLYLKTVQKKSKTKREIRKAIRKQLNFLHRDLQIKHMQLDQLTCNPLDKKMYKYLLVIQTLYDQQKQMYDTHTHSIEHRIVSIHQSHVRPIVRGKANAKVEFGAKINVSLNNGYTFIDHLSWKAFNKGTHLISSVEQYKARWGYNPKEVLADKIYCNRESRAKLKELGIQLKQNHSADQRQ
ncbi:MAG: IS5 family transposase [Bacteroidetes bacterium]|nr:IS5 family transposase [Bacteroidota bacterium]